MAGVLEQCQVNTLDTMLISVPALHRILSLELATIQVGLIKIFCFDWLKELSITMRIKKFESGIVEFSEYCLFNCFLD